MSECVSRCTCPSHVEATGAAYHYFIYLNPESRGLYLTFEEALIPCQAIVVAPDECNAWIDVAHLLRLADIKKRPESWVIQRPRS